MVKAGSLRKRYVLFKLSEPQMEEDRLKRGLYAQALKFFGEYGLSSVALKLVSYDKVKNKGILRCEREALEKVLGFLALIETIDNIQTRPIALKSSGTIKGLG
ncbi:hypothetical protein HY988_00020 [Candidatus Micrarchaeota archaeon]|nr:hypothetical protein [Candidatus Micrarchaeota archaeon]